MDARTDDTSWHDQARCRDDRNNVDPDWWFSHRAADRLRAYEICSGCPVVDACTDGAIANGETDGIWGGLPEHQLRRAVAADRRRRRTA